MSGEADVIRPALVLLADEQALAALDALEQRDKEYERRMHLILSTIYSTHGFLVDGEIDTAAKFRAIERLARLDWDEEGMSRVV